jgi:hypothetical protein
MCKCKLLNDVELILDMLTTYLKELKGYHQNKFQYISSVTDSQGLYYLDYQRILQ